MEAKDTVMGQRTIKDKYGLDFGCEAWKTIQLLLEGQAEISFKAGIKVGYSVGIVEGQYTNHKRHGKKMVQAREEGRKEVVEWVNAHISDGQGVAKWQAQLKAWGLTEEVSVKK